MALNKVYTRINWEDYPSENTDIDEINLNKMDSAIDALDNRIVSQDALKVDKSAINGNIADWTMDETTGVITITKYNGEKVIFDLNIEKIPVEFSMSDDGIITMTTEDGTQFTADIGFMIPVLTFEDSATIAVSVTGTGKNKTYSFSIKTGSVTDAMLQPNYLADIRVESANASAYAQSANAKSLLAESYAVGGTGTREGEDTDNAKYYMEQAKQQTGGIPTKVSELENDAGYITKSVSDLENYYDKTNIDKKIDEIPKTDLTNYLTKTGDGSNLTAAFEEATTLEELTTGEKLSSILGKLKLAVKNLKLLISLIGTTDISTIGDGTITGGLSDVNGKLSSKFYSDRLTAKNVKTITVNDYGCAMLLVAGATMYYFCNGYLVPISNTSDSVTMTLSNDYKTITVSNTTGESNYFLSMIIFTDSIDISISDSYM
uniref:Uncharacterized protein n=1 Tax=Siphoviridae sp. ctLeh52 TaxID=2827849 RepID=A0A8S5RX03_9CAUD|nr:MAG TPA: hypothetical protein [Siphoviridae sp. ctLeh52]